MNSAGPAWRARTHSLNPLAGIVQPLQPVEASLGYGLGKAEEYDEAATEATRSRKLLDVEVEETEELKKQRQVRACLRMCVCVRAPTDARRWV